MYSKIYMQLAIDEAWKYQLLTYPNPAVGALILYKNSIVAIEAHQKAGTSHAEVLALLKAYENISGNSITFDKFNSQMAHNFLYSLPKGFFKDSIIYVTLEPCSHIDKTPSCASLLAYLKPKKVVIATLDPIKGHDNGIAILKQSNIQVKYSLLKKEAKDLLEPFLIWQNKPFILFKIAQTSNGKIGGGYLSSKASLIHVHQLRTVCSQMIIGGNTVRVDRPTLDCRFINANPPNVTIYSKQDNFDKNIPLFSILNREVIITNSLKELNKPSFILVEGGEGMLNSLKDKIDWLLQYQTPKLSSHNSHYNIKLRVEYLYQDKKDIDLLLWSRVIKY